jgi:hypothetical protein
MLISPSKPLLTDEEEQDLQYHYSEQRPRVTAQPTALAAALRKEAEAHDEARKSSAALALLRVRSSRRRSRSK